MTKTLPLLALLSLAAPALAAPLANSVADFSGTQGYRNWYYGYGFEDGVSFTPLTFNAGSQAWLSTSPTSYPWISATGQASATADYAGITAWSIRRWVSPLEADLLLDLTMQRGTWEPYNVGDGVWAAAFVDQTAVLGQTLNPWDFTIYHHTVPVHVHPGSTVDFITGSFSTMWGDGTSYTATITQIPEPASLALLALTTVTLLSRRHA